MLIILFISIYSTLDFCNVLNFDDIDVIGNYIAIPRPYKNFVFRRINPGNGFPYNYIPVGNTTIQNTSFNNAASSNPNVIFTTRESLSISKTNNETFNIYHLEMTSIYINNMPIFINTFRYGNLISNMILSLSIGHPKLFDINVKNIDEVVIGCENISLEKCAHIAYDNIAIG